MVFLPSLPANAGIGDIFKYNPDIRQAMNELGRAIMRGTSELSAGQRELIAAYVSHLNACHYCFNGHSAMARSLGIAADEIERICELGADGAADRKLAPILAFVRKLTIEPSSVGQADADAVYAAGWTERGLHDAILVCCRFSFMNRLSIGHGLDPDAVDAADRLSRMSYAKESGNV